MSSGTQSTAGRRAFLLTVPALVIAVPASRALAQDLEEALRRKAERRAKLDAGAKATISSGKDATKVFKDPSYGLDPSDKTPNIRSRPGSKPDQ